MKIKHLILLSTVLFSLASTANAATTLKIASLLPDGTSYMAAMRQAGKEIGEQTEGRVKLKFYPGGVMGNDESVMRKIRIGQLHGGAVTSGALSNYSQDAQLYGLPFLFHSREETEYVRRHMDKEIFDDLEKAGMAVIGLSNGGFSYLMSETPITQASSLKDHKVWIPEGDEVSSTALSYIGVSPVTLPISDVYTGLQTGLIDVIGVSSGGAIALQWHSKVSYVTDVPINYLTGWVVVSQKAMRKVSAADQAIIRSVMSRHYAQLDKDAWAAEEEARAALIASGVNFVRPSPDEEATWRELGLRATEQVVNNSSYSPERLNKLRRLLTEFRAQVSGQ